MVYQFKENSDKYGLVYSAPMQKNTTLDKIYADFSESTPNDFAGHTMGNPDIVVFSEENGQRSFYFISERTAGKRLIHLYAKERLKKWTIS